MNLVGKELDKVSLKMEKTELASRAAGMYLAVMTFYAEVIQRY